MINVEGRYNLNIIGQIILHYGAEYLDASIKAIHPFVDKIIISYTNRPSQGHSKKLKCPETEAELMAIAYAASNKVVWKRGKFANEGEHRSQIFKYSRGYDICIVSDADEVWEPADIEHALKLAYETDKRYIGISGFINFWRSFNYACYDSFRPVRLINLRNAEGTHGEINARIYHFSCAQKRETIEYKWTVSGHAEELRPHWIDEILFGWTPEKDTPHGLHPVALDLWKATPYDRFTLPEILQQHKNFNKEFI